MAKNSLPDVSAKLVGDASGLVAEVKRGTTAVSTGTAKMEASIDRFQNSVRRKFSVGDIGKQFMQGLGIGSGFQLATTAVEHFAGYWRQAAESAAEVARHAERATNALNAGLEKRRTTPQNIDALEKEQRIMQGQLTGAQQNRKDNDLSMRGISGQISANAFTPWKIFGALSKRFTGGLLASQEAERIKADLQEIANTIADAKTRLKKEAADKAATELKLLQKSSGEMVDSLRAAIFGDVDEGAFLPKRQHQLDLERQGMPPGSPLSDSLSRQGLFLNTPGASQVEGEQKKHTSLLQQILAALRTRPATAANTAAPVGTIIW